MVIVSSQHCSQKLRKIAEKGNLKMRKSSKPCYKLVSVVHNYILCIFQIIERICDDPILQNNYPNNSVKSGYRPNNYMLNSVQVWLKSLSNYVNSYLM